MDRSWPLAAVVARLPGFIDSIGGDSFTASGEYRSGPSPHGLVPYEVTVADDHVVATLRLPPSSRLDDGDGFPAIENSSIQPTGTCQNDTEIARTANEEGSYQEDFRTEPTWVQHDVADWPDLDSSGVDGWFRSDEAQVEGRAHLIGDLLVYREWGRIIDLASPPGTARYLHGGDRPVGPETMTLLQVDPAENAIVVSRVIWVGPEGIAAASADPPPSAHLVTTGPDFGYELAPAAILDGQVGDLVDVVAQDGLATSVIPH